MYKVKDRRPKKTDFDLIVIGTGSGGGVASHIAVKAGKSVAIIEKETIGGECPNFGCVPTKALLQAAETYRIAQEADQFGIHTSNVAFSYGEIRNWKNEAVSNTGTEEGEQIYKEEGIKLIKGEAQFLTPWIVSVKGVHYSAKQFLIATGTKNVTPPIPGLAETGYITYREAIDLPRPPKSLFVIGGGAIGCEFTELFSSFGTKVHIADIAPRLLALEDESAGELLGVLFEERGIGVHTNAKILRIAKQGGEKVVYFEVDGKKHQIAVEEILLSSGKAPNTDLGLVNAGVEFDRGGIKVNSFMQTTCKHIYAAGDVVGPFRFTHTASYQSRIAAHNMYHRKRKFRADYRAVPRCTFVDPEIAAVGATEQQLRESSVKYQVAAVPISIIGRSNTSNQDTGFVKVLTDKRGIILGACVVCPRAGEVIHELALAVRMRMSARTLANTIHAFPTWSEAVRMACQKIIVK